MPVTTFNGLTFDPANLSTPAATGKYVLLQAKGPLTADESSTLLQRNVQVQAQVNRDSPSELPSYLCKVGRTNALTGTAATAARAPTGSITPSASTAPTASAETNYLQLLRDLSFVQTVVPYPVAAVVSPMLADPKALKPNLSFVEEKDPNSPKGDYVVFVDIILHADSGKDGAAIFADLEKLKANAATADTVLLLYTATSVNLCVLMSPDFIQKAARLDEIASIQPYYSDEVDATLRARVMIGLPPKVDGLITPTITQTYTGSGQVVGLVEEGFDDGRISPDQIYPAFRLQNLGAAPTALVFSNGAVPASRHGVAVAGVITGGILVNGSDTKSSCGMAPKARLFWQLRTKPPTVNLFQLLVNVLTPPTIESRARKLLAQQAVIQNNSWAVVARSKRTATQYFPLNTVPHFISPYAGTASQVDDITFRNPNLLLVFCSGNEGEFRHRKETQPAGQLTTTGFNRQIHGPGAAKNALTVGASIGGRRLLQRLEPNPPTNGMKYDTANCMEGHPLAGTPPPPPPYPTAAQLELGVAEFSGKGPTMDGILKPEVVAPGCGILTTDLQTKGPTTANGPADPKNFSGEPKLTYGDGTSIATPVVSGLAACLREAAKTLHHIDMSGLVLRAMIVNGAVSLVGMYTWICDYGDATPYTAASAKPPPANTANPRRFSRVVLGKAPDCVQGYGQVSYTRSIKHIVRYQSHAGAMVYQAPGMVPPSGHTAYWMDTLPNPAITILPANRTVPTSPTTLPLGARMLFEHTLDLDALRRRFSVTFAYYDSSVAPHVGLTHDLSITVSVRDANQAHAQNHFTLFPDPINKYPHETYDESPARDTTQPPLKPASLGTVRRITWAQDQSPLATSNAALQVDVRIWQVNPAVVITTPVPFALAWLSETILEVQQARGEIETIGGVIPAPVPPAPLWYPPPPLPPGVVQDPNGGHPV